MRVEWRTERSPAQAGGDVRVTVGECWVRCAVYYGQPPGSQRGVWRTGIGDLTGWNVRVGTARRALTVFVHVRKGRAA